MRARSSIALALVALAGCMNPPRYQPPKPAMPAQWKVEAPFRVAMPQDDLAKGAWWERFGEPTLNELASRALSDSPTLAAATARLAQARATFTSVSGQRWPQVAAIARDTRTRITQNRPLNNYNAPNFSTVQTDLVFGMQASYEVDFAGRVASAVASAKASAEQAAADLETARLLLIADLATAYFNLRQTDIELDVLASSIELQKRSLGLASTRHQLGAGSALDVAQQQALIDTTLTQIDILRRQRALFEHAIATLAGTPAPLFSLPPEKRDMRPPEVPIGVPSDVLERRPDVASAERAMAVANAQVGIANAAFYPSITLGLTYGQESRHLNSLWDVPSLVWSAGMSLAQPLFDGGRIRGNYDAARAGYDIALANYRRVVLTAMQEAEDGIIGLAALDRASAQAEVAVESARRTLELVNARYEGGVASPLEVISAQQSLLSAERLASQLVGQRLLTSVFLVRALGGGWERREKISARD
ncbi:MAG TPA: efflux transporter outer membrane subunit [Burkholderiales bacterium]|nr:efflux transporter outer membrane subunit [Burkholderiales bacterium]